MFKTRKHGTDFITLTADAGGKNMVTFSDISWLIMTLSNQLAEVVACMLKQEISLHIWAKQPIPFYVLTYSMDDKC